MEGIGIDTSVHFLFCDWVELKESRQEIGLVFGGFWLDFSPC